MLNLSLKDPSRTCLASQVTDVNVQTRNTNLLLQPHAGRSLSALGMLSKGLFNVKILKAFQSQQEAHDALGWGPWVAAPSSPCRGQGGPWICRAAEPGIWAPRAAAAARATLGARDGQKNKLSLPNTAGGLAGLGLRLQGTAVLQEQHMHQRPREESGEQMRKRQTFSMLKDFPVLKTSWFLPRSQRCYSKAVTQSLVSSLHM